MMLRNSNNKTSCRFKILFLLCLFQSSTEAGPNNESFYQAIAAEVLGGETEVTMPDRTRCDIVTATHAIEVDFKRKWAESLGQSLNYAFQADKRAGIVLIVENSTDTKELLRLNSIIQHNKLDVTLWMLDAERDKLTKWAE